MPHPNHYGEPVDPLAHFSELVRGPEPPLDVALALIAAVERPEVDPETLLVQLDELADSIRATDGSGLCAELFGDGGFAGDRADYYDPSNSLLDRVLERRKGIPITLAAVGIEVGRRKDIELIGVGMPGHFLLGASLSGTGPLETGPSWYFDAFDGGRRLDAAGAVDLFTRLHGDQLSFDPNFLASVDSAAIIERVLNNLRGSAVRRDDRGGLFRSLRLQSCLPARSIDARRTLAAALAADGRFGEAADVHDSLRRDDPERADEYQHAAIRLRARLN